MGKEWKDYFVSFGGVGIRHGFAIRWWMDGAVLGAIPNEQVDQGDYELCFPTKWKSML